MTVSTHEFIRRFLLHVLPSKFVKIRHYGILSNRNRRTKLPLCQRLTGIKVSRDSLRKLTAKELLLKLTGVDLSVCPCCRKASMVQRRTLQPRASPLLVTG
jgi:hypothetical protein